MTSFSSLILVYDKEKMRFCWKILLYHYSLYPWKYFTQKFVVPICTHSMEFDSFYRAGIYGRPCRIKEIGMTINRFKSFKKILSYLKRVSPISTSSERNSCFFVRRFQKMKYDLSCRFHFPADMVTSTLSNVSLSTVYFWRILGKIHTNKCMVDEPFLEGTVKSTRVWFDVCLIR